MKVAIKDELKKSEIEFYKIPQKDREGVIFWSTDDFIIGKVYDVISIENGWYRILDESGEDYLYPPQMFNILDNA